MKSILKFGVKIFFTLTNELTNYKHEHVRVTKIIFTKMITTYIKDLATTC